MTSETVDENEAKYDSGASKFGNFINYYQFNPPDNRLSLLPSNIWKVHRDKDLICFDIGCNVGDLTRALHNHISQEIAVTCEASGERERIPKCNILAIDLDENLINIARDLTRNDNITYECANILDKSSEHIVKQYLNKHNRTHFDITFVFSVTMWIHLNHGDSGLRRFLLNVTKLTDVLVIEPQPWRCYLRAVQRMRRANKETFSEYSNLKMRGKIENDIQAIMTSECNFKKIYESERTSWNRAITFYERKES